MEYALYRKQSPKVLFSLEKKKETPSNWDLLSSFPTAIALLLPWLWLQSWHPHFTHPRI
jgi:hypothetical protein